MNLKRELNHISFIVDANCVNARQRLAPMNLLEAWAEKRIIRLFTTEIAQAEMAAGGNDQRMQKAYKFIYTMSAITNLHELEKLKEIELILFPDGAKNQNQLNDVEIVFNARKYGRPLITNDGGSTSQPGGILGNRDRLAKIGAPVLNPVEAVDRVRRALDERDHHAREWVKFYNKELPEWVGKD